MGNIIGERNKAKVMRTNGETFKFKTPIEAWDIIKRYPGHMLLESESVKHMGLRAKPLGLQEQLKPNRIYFLLEMPLFLKRKSMKRTQSDINSSMKDRLGCLTLQRRSISDLSARLNGLRSDEFNGPRPSSEPVRVKVRLPKAQLTRLMEKSRDEEEVARKIIDLYCTS